VKPETRKEASPRLIRRASVAGIKENKIIIKRLSYL